MEKEKIIAKWEQEVENGDLEISITPTRLYDFAKDLACYIGADEPITHDDMISWIKENYWSDSDVDLDDYNEWLENNNYYEDIIHRNTEYEINDYFDGREPYDIIDAVLGNDYSTNDEFFKETIYGIESFDDWYDLIEDRFRDDAIDENTVNDDTIAEIWENEEEIQEKVEELYAIENAEYILQKHSDILEEVEQAKEFLNAYNPFYDCTIDEEEKRNYVVLRCNGFDDIDAIYILNNNYSFEEVQSYISKLSDENEELPTDVVTEKLGEKFGAKEISARFWNMWY
jgi:hypothetical protein